MKWRVPGQEVRRETVEKDCRARGLNIRRMPWIVVGLDGESIGMIDDHDECEWVNVSSGTGSCTQVFPDKFHRAVKRLCVCVCGTLHFILHTFLHPIIVFFSQHMPIPSQPVLL